MPGFPLSHFDFNRGAGLQICLVDAEPSRSHLNDRIAAVLIKILMQPALARIVERAERLRGPGEAFMRVIADRSVRHRGKQNRQLKLQLGRQIVHQVSFPVALDADIFFAEEKPSFPPAPAADRSEDL